MPIKRPTLHSAIRAVLRDLPTHSASTKRLSDEIASRDLYTRKDGDRAPDWQISRRAKKFPRHFEVEGDTVRLMETQKKS